MDSAHSCGVCKVTCVLIRRDRCELRRRQSSGKVNHNVKNGNVSTTLICV